MVRAAAPLLLVLLPLQRPAVLLQVDQPPRVQPLLLWDQLLHLDHIDRDKLPSETSCYTYTTGLSIAFFSDSFAATSADKVISIVRKFSPDLAAKMRPYINYVLHGRPSIKGSTHICGGPFSMWVFALFLFEVSCIFWVTSCNFLIVPWALYVGLLITLIHASFRERNLKGRLNRFRKEFREAW